MSEAKDRGWLQRIGPGIVTAAVVLGPGSIVSVSKVGATYGYSLVWLLVCAAVFMIVFSTMSARFGCVSGRSLLDTVAGSSGRWLAVVLGVSAWLVSAGFQVGNNMGVLTGMEELLPVKPWLWPPLFTVGSIVFLFTARRLYRALERLMLVLVGVMILAFVANLFAAGVDVVGVAKGLIPRIPAGDFSAAKAMVATTFSIVAAFYLAYLVQEKQWGLAEYRTGIRDASMGIAILALMTLVIMLSAAGAFAGRDLTLQTAGDVARQLEGVFGTSARYIFCLGLVAASFSSFIVNSLIGGGLLADGLGIGRGFDNPRVKVAASAALLVGMTIALVAMKYEQSRVGSIIIAQAMTLLVAPLTGIVLLVLANSRSVMGERRNGIAINIVAVVGLLVVLWMTWETGRSLIGPLLRRLQG
jgi:Mn2+/Fe2+ NRAMP family transporter